MLNYKEFMGGVKKKKGGMGEGRGVGGGGGAFPDLAWRFTEGYIFPFFRPYLTNLTLLWYNISCTYLLFLHVFFGPLAQLVRATGS